MFSCGEIAYHNFTVLAPDPHRFDRDKDGVGCERSLHNPGAVVSWEPGHHLTVI